MIRLGSATDPVHAMGDALKKSSLGQAGERPPGDAGRPRLLERDEAPLALGDIANARERAGHAATYSRYVILCSSMP